MKDINVSDKIKEQTQLVIELLEKAKSLIKYKPLVKVSENEIEAYIQYNKKTFPPDFKYWLTNHGSGRIQLIEDSIYIPSIGDLLNSEHDGRSYDDDDPSNCWDRIYLYYSGAPSVTALDSTIADKSGCTPVVETYSYSNKVSSVYSSSWQMYLINQIISAARKILESRSSFVKVKREYLVQSSKAAEDICDIYYPSLDKDLERAYIRAMKQNKTKYAEGRKNPFDITETVMRSLSYDDKKSSAGKIKEKLDEEFGIEYDDFHNIKSKFPSYIENKIPKNIKETVSMIEERIKKGSADTYSECQFIEESTKKPHIGKLYELLEHPLYELRKAALKGLSRLKPKNLEKKLQEIYKRTKDEFLLSKLESIKFERDLSSFHKSRNKVSKSHGPVE